MLRIGIDAQSTQGAKTGIGYYTHSLLEHYRATDDISCFSYGTNTCKDLNTLQRFLWENITLPALAKKDKLNILHVTAFAGPYAKIAPKKITTVHDLIGMIYPQNLGAVSRLYWQRWLPACAANSDMIIADSENTKKDIMRLLRIPEKKIKVIYLAVNERFKPMDANKEIFKKYNIDKKYILNVGTIEPRKNIPMLIEAFSDYLKEAKRDNLLLVIAGKKGWDYQRCCQYISNLGMEKSVVFCDYVDDQDLPALYNFAEVFVYPSLYEGFGLPVLEALSCGAVTICSNTSSLPEIAGDAAFLIEPDNKDSIKSALQDALQNNTLRQELSDKALRQAKKFSWPETIAKTIGIYKEISN